MCLIIYAPQGHLIPEAWIKTSWETNDDGAGYMFAAGGELHVRKPFFKLDELLSSYAADYAAHGQDTPFIVHLRWSTAGKLDERNTHPHILDNGRCALVHNGILKQFDTWKGAEISDTVMFCSTVLACRSAEQILDDHFCGVLGEMIGPGNKLAMMDCIGNVSIVNIESGIWDGEFWLSNDSYDARAQFPPTITTVATVSKPADPPPAIVRGVSFTGKATGYDSRNLPARYRDEDGYLWGVPDPDERDDWHRYRNQQADDAIEASQKYFASIDELEYMVDGDLKSLTSEDLFAIGEIAVDAALALEASEDQIGIA